LHSWLLGLLYNHGALLPQCLQPGGASPSLPGTVAPVNAQWEHSCRQGMDACWAA
jgi:hypothetical protein